MVEWMSENFFAPVMAGVIAACFGILNFFIKRKSKDTTLIREEQLKCYGQIRLLCQKYNWEKITKNQLIKKFLFYLDKNYLYIEDPLIVKMSEIIKLDKADNIDIKTQVKDLIKEIDEVYIVEKERLGYKRKSIDWDYLIDLGTNIVLCLFLFCIFTNILMFLINIEQIGKDIINTVFGFLFIGTGAFLVVVLIIKFVAVIVELTKKRRNRG